MRLVNLILLLIAAVFFVWILNEVGWDTLGRYLWQVGWYWPLLLLPYGLVNWLEAWSWKYILVDTPARTSVGRLFWLRLGGEALNQLTPTASLGGEPFKASRLQADGVPLEMASASVVIMKGILVLSLVLYIFVGLALAPVYLPEAAKHMLFLSLAALGLAAAGIIFVVVQRREPFGNSFRFLNRRGWLPHFLRDQEGFLENLDTAMSQFYRQYPSRAVLAFFLFFLSWLLHSVEVYLMFWLLGHPISPGMAVCLDALAMLFTALGFFIPAAMGVQEGGNILLALGFKLGFDLGAAFSILRRIREAFWLCLGLVVVWREK
ncbi:MAG: flippase-like domain-containing protein [Proteobacteria bacterium]|nr:flippase-like domain-containing protein [Pseudomonadota bacterium]MBU4448260.1 flippase-like domain-containing protein [Pseudomonadota bacterium]MCG2771973.1 flippase-like domain-containing protein [Desulfobacterales bacterium]